jgi:hypothetical protein
MSKVRKRTHEHVKLDPARIKRARKALQAKTEPEIIEQAVDLAISESESNRLALEANERFLKSGVEIKDVFGKLDRKMWPAGGWNMEMPKLVLEYRFCGGRAGAPVSPPTQCRI